MAHVSLSFTGSKDEIEVFVRRQLASYPAAGYGTWFNWPPGERKDAEGKPIAYLAPTDHGDGRWTVRGSSSDSCD